jgi:NTE family protein
MAAPVARPRKVDDRGDRHDIRTTQKLASWGCGTTMHVTDLIAPRVDGEDHDKDIDFTASGIRARRGAGHADIVKMIERSPWNLPADPMEGVIEHH